MKNGYCPRPKFAPPEAIHGHGEQSLYVYFAETERRLAILEGRGVWPCKVGSAIGSVERRILGQGIKASMARMPIIGLVVRCASAEPLERQIHKALRREGAWIRESSCAEWFDTTPDRVLKLSHQLAPAAFVTPTAPPQQWSAPYGRGRRISCDFAWRSPGVMHVLTTASPMSKLAKSLGISVSAVSQWARVPLRHIEEIERITGISREVLRPDIYDGEGWRYAEDDGDDEQRVA